MKIRLAFVTFLFCSFVARPSRADTMHEFIMSCTYGVLAGTMVGAASLAFSSKPGDNLNAVARGASIGLYAGILLGLYVVYAVPNPEDQAVQDATGGTTSYHFTPPPRFMIAPTFSPQNKIAGAIADVRVTSF